MGFGTYGSCASICHSVPLGDSLVDLHCRSGRAGDARHALGCGLRAEALGLKAASSMPCTFAGGREKNRGRRKVRSFSHVSLTKWVPHVRRPH